MKKSILFAMCLLLAATFGQELMAQVTPSPTLVDGIYYYLDANSKTATVTYKREAGGAYTLGDYAGSLIIPEYIWAEDPANPETGDWQYKVTAIGDQAFMWCTGLYSVSIPATVETLGVNLFSRAPQVNEITIKDGTEPITFTQVKDSATGMTITTFDDLSTQCQIFYMGRDITINSSVEWPELAFHGWTALQKLTIGKNVTKIPDGFMRFCRDLHMVQVNTPKPLPAGAGMFMFFSETDAHPENITLNVPEGLGAAYKTMDVWKQMNIQEVDEQVIGNFTWVTSSFDFSATTNDGVRLFYKYIKNSEGKNIAAMVTMPQVWYEGSTWSSQYPYMASVINVPATVTDPEGETFAVTAINDYTFRGATNLTELNLPVSVTSFGGEAIEGCMNLKRLDLHNTLTHTGWLAFARSGLEEVTIPTKIDEWDMCAFQECEYLTKVTFREGSETEILPARMFWGCTALRTITLPNSIKEIGEGTFSGCMALVHIDLPASLEKMTGRMFHACSIRDLYIPASVSLIEGDVLLGCNSLTKLTVDPANKLYDSRDNCNAVIRTADNTLIAGCSASVIPATVDSIGWGAFDEIETMQSITLPANLKKIAEGGLMNLNGLSIIKSEIQNPTGVLSEYSIDSWYGDFFDRVTLYVPAGTADAYKVATGWSKFKNIVETEPVAVTMLQPAELGGADVSFENVDTEVDLTNAVIDNLYVTCDTTAGDTYDSKEKAFVFQTVVDELQMSSVLESPNVADAVRNNFAGIVLEVPAGEGVISVTVKTSIGRSVCVTVDNMENPNAEKDGVTVTLPYTTTYFTQPVKGDIQIEYNVTESAYVFIYGAEAVKDDAAPQLVSARRIAKAGRAVKEDVHEDVETPQSIVVYGVKTDVKKDTSGLNDLRESRLSTGAQKVMIDGRIYILQPDGSMYQTNGARVQ